MKYIKQKVIKNQPYYYFEYPLTIQHKKTTFTRYLGKQLPQNIKSTITTYFNDIAQIKSTTITSSYFPYTSPKIIEQAKYQYQLFQHELFQQELTLFRTLFCILFVLNSNRSEGSNVTRPDIEQIISKKITPKTIIEKEIINSFDALNFAFTHFKWNEKNIKKIHHYLFHNIHPEIAGKYKKINNVVANSPTTPWQEVPTNMKKLLNWFKNNKQTYTPQLALEFYWRFESIHPFEDGNGRVGRILLNTILVQQGYCPIIFFSENHRAHCQSIAKAREGKTSPLAQQYLYSIQKTEKAINKYKAEGIITGGSTHIGKWELQQGKIKISH